MLSKKQKQSVRSAEIRNRAIAAVIQPLEKRVMLSITLKPAEVPFSVKAISKSTVLVEPAKPVTKPATSPAASSAKKTTPKPTTTTTSSSTKLTGGVSGAATVNPATPGFNAGDLAVYTVGTGTAALTSAATVVELDDYSTTLTGQTSPVNQYTVTGLTAGGTTAAEGEISLSPNGEYVAVPGYNSAAGTAAPYNVSGNQIVDTVGSSGSVATTTALGVSVMNKDNIYGAAFDGNNAIYAGGYNGAVYQTLGASGSTPASTITSTSVYSAQVYNGSLYIAGYKTLPGSITLVTNPTTSPTLSNAISPLTYTNTSGGGVSYDPNEFTFATLSPNDTSADTIYVADHYNYGVDKLSLVNGSWVMTGELGGSSTDTLAGVYGIVAEPVAGGEMLYMSTKAGIYSYLDASGFNGAFTNQSTTTKVAPSTGLLTTVATAPTNEAFRGLAFAPQSSLTVATNPVSSVTKIEGQTTTLFSAATAGTDATVQWQVNTGSGFVNIVNGTDADGVIVSGATSNTLKLSNVSILESGYQYRAVFSDPSGTFTPVTSSYATVNVTFTPGDLIIEQAGTAASQATGSAAAPIVLDEYSPTGTLVSSIPLPTATSGSNNPITVTGTGTSDGEIALSANATTLLIPGYDTTVGTTTITSSSTILREIGLVSATGIVNTTTTLGSALESGNIYSVASADGTKLYAAGSKGIAYITAGSTSGTVLSSQNTYGLNVTGGQLYDSSDVSTTVLSTVGSGLPTTSGQTASELPGVTFSGTAGLGVGYSREFAFANLSGGSSPDTLYVADYYNDCIDKLSLVNGSWVLNGTIGAYGYAGNPLADVVGIAVEPVSGGEQLFMTISNNATGTSKLETITDPYGYDSAGPSPDQSGTSNTVFSQTPTLTTLATANGTNATPFKGLAFVPQTALTVSANPASSVNGAVGNSTTLFSAVAAGTDATVQWQVNMGSGFVNLSNGTDNNGEVVAGATTNTLTLSNLVVADSGYQYRAVFTDPSTTFASVNSTTETLTISNTPVVNSVSPNYDYPTGAGYTSGKTITITGSNLTGATAVDFGSVAVTSFTVNGAGTQITVTDPSESAGVVDVTVIANGQTSATNSGDKFYYEATPTVTGVSPNTGSDSGGTAITITGTGFLPGSTVSLVPTAGGSTVAATSVVFVSPTQITAVAPADTNATTMDVEVTTPEATSPANPGTSPGDTFTYTPTSIANAIADTVGSVVTIDSSPVVTAVLTTAGETVNGVSYTNYQIFVQDTAAGGDAIDLFGTTLNSSYVPAVGDTIQVTGETSIYHGVYELEDITAISKTGTATVPSVVTGYTANQLNTTSLANVPAAYDDKLVELSNITISDAPGNVNLAPTWPTTNETGDITDSSNSSSNPLELYYYPSSYAETNANFYGLATPTSPVNYVGFVQIYTSNGVNTPEFIPVEQVNGSGQPVQTDAFSESTNEPAISSNTLAETDNFDEAQRGDTITVTVSRSEDADAATIQYQLVPDSAVAGTDYDAGTGAPATTATLTFGIGVSTQTYTISVNPTPGDHGDKDFSIIMANAQTTTSPAAYLAAIAGGPVNMVIIDPNSSTTAGNVSTTSTTLNENASIGTTGAQTTSTTTNGTTTTTLTTSKLNIEAPGNTERGDSVPSYALMNFNDQGDNYDSLTTEGGTGSAGTIKTIDGIELETFASPEYYDQSGTLDVYVVDSSTTLPSSAYTSASTMVNSGGTKYQYSTTDDTYADGTTDTYANGLGGTIQGTVTNSNGVITGSSLGTLYPLGSIAYQFTQTPTGYQPFNLATLNPIGTYQIAKAISNGTAFTIVIAPGDNSVTATFGGSTNAVSDESPILRVNFANTLPTWTTATVAGDSSSEAVWIVPTNTLAVAGTASIVSDPGSQEPNIYGFGSAAAITFSTGAETSTYQDFHIGGITLTGGALATVASVRTTSSNNYVLVLGTTGSTVAPTFSIDSTSSLDLKDNDLIDLYGSGSTPYSAVKASIDQAADGGAWDKLGGLTSSVAATNSSTYGLGYAEASAVSDTSFDGVTVGSDAVLVKYTYLGDTQLRGTVGLGDYQAVLTNYGSPTATDWIDGNFHYGGVVGLSDYQEVLTNYGAVQAE
jgi:hypothetical protein